MIDARTVDVRLAQHALVLLEQVESQLSAIEASARRGHLNKLPAQLGVAPMIESTVRSGRVRQQLGQLRAAPGR